jgi:lysophospholipase L1-like esterase
MSKLIYLKRILSLCVAVILSFLLANCLMFVYSRPVAMIYTPNGASRAIRRPYSFIVNGTEGYGFSQIDKNGYSNPNFSLNENYILMMGSSHTQGKEIAPSKKYSVLTNNALANGVEKLFAYNIACDAHFLPTIIKHFRSAVKNFPDANCITIEIGSTDFSIDELQEVMQYHDITDSRTAKTVFAEQNWLTKIINLGKESFPLAVLITNHIETLRASNSVDFNHDATVYKATLIEDLSLIRSLYTGPIVFIYHPETILQADGTMALKYSQTLELFKAACEETNIDFIDVGDKFAKHFEMYYELPYGFSNTSPGKGHLNETGHQIMANAILEYLEVHKK